MLKETNAQAGQQPRPQTGSGPSGTSETFNPPPASTFGAGKIALVVVCLLVVVGLVWLARKHQAAAAAGPPAGGRGAGAGGPVPVVLGAVAQKDVPIYLDGLGTVQAFNTVTVHARVDGQLQKVAFVEGQDVHTNDLLAQIDPAPYQATLAQNTARKAQDEALLANARLDLKREEDLFLAKVDSQQLYDTQKALVDQYTATVQADQAAIDSAKVQLDYTTINAPIEGRTGIRQVDQGNIIHATDANGLVVLTQLKPISVVFTLPEQTLGDIHKELANGELAVLAVDRDNSTVLSEGKLAVIDNQIDTTTGTIKLKATFPNEDLRLWPGQFVNARLKLAVRKNGIVVPASVIQRGPDGAYAFVAVKAATATNSPAPPETKPAGSNQPPALSVEIRPVTVAQIEAGEALIDSGLKPGERVVVDGQYKLQAGSRVRPSQGGKTTQPKADAEAP